MISIFEISNPFRVKPKLEKYSFGWRLIWLWFSFAVWPPVTINTMRRAWRNEEIEQLKQERSEMCSIIDGSIKEINRYRKALEEIITSLRERVGDEEILRNHVTTYQIAQRALDDE